MTQFDYVLRDNSGGHREGQMYYISGQEIEGWVRSLTAAYDDRQRANRTGLPDESPKTKKLMDLKRRLKALKKVMTTRIRVLNYMNKK